MRVRTAIWAYCSGLLLWIGSAATVAAPAVSDVSGTVAHGQQVQISGSAFGTKSPAKPYLWAPMDGTHQPSSLGIVTSWAAVENMRYAAGEGVGNSGAIKGNPSAGSGETIWTARVDASGFAWDDYSSRMYLYRRTKQSFQVTRQHNWKILRLWPSSGTQPNWYVSNFGIIGVSPPVESGGYAIEDPESAFYHANVWRTEQVLTRSNSASRVSDATYQHYVDGRLVGQMPKSGYTLRFKDAGNSPITQIYPVHGVEANDANAGVAPSGSSYWVDDVYLDNTWARVMIGDAATLANCRQLEVQIPYEWTSSRIGVTLNIQAFPESATPYLFVVDAAGNASPGFPLEQTVRPEPPTNVTAT